MDKRLEFLISLPVAAALWCGSFLLLVFFPSFATALALLAATVHGLLALPYSKRFKQFGLSLALVATLGLVTPRPAKAIFGEDLILMAQQLAQLKMIYDQARQNLEIIKQNVLALARKETYRNVLNNAARTASLDPSVFTRATLPLTGANIPATREQLANLSQISLAGSSSQNVMTTLAQITSWQNSNRSPVNAWQSSVYSNNPNLNTQAAQQNLTNLGLVQLYEQGQQTLAVNGMLAQQMMLQNMKDRNQAVSALNFWQGVADSASRQPYALGGMEEDLKTHRLF